MNKVITDKMRKCHMLVKLLMVYIAILLLAYVLMCAAYALPIQNMCKHVAESKEVFENEGEYPRIIQGHYNTLLKLQMALHRNRYGNMDLYSGGRSA